MPTMLRDIVCAALTSQRDLMLLPEATRGESTVRAARDAHADVVIVGVPEPAGLHDYDRLLYEMPNACLVGVSSDGRHAAVARLTPQHELVSDVNAGTLVDAVRAGAAAARERAHARISQ